MRIEKLTISDLGDSRGIKSIETEVDRVALGRGVETSLRIVTGRYHDTFHQVDGRWCFDTRTMLVDLVGDLSRHLLFELGAGPRS